MSGLISGFRSTSRIWRRCWIGIRDTFGGPAKFFKIASEFFTEAAVLVAVFPILDTIIEPLGGVQKVTWALVVWSEGIAAGLLVLAGIMSKAEKGS
jgi:hypothetical protein